MTVSRSMLCIEMSKIQSFTFEKKTNKKHLNLSKLYFNLLTTNQLTYY